MFVRFSHRDPQQEFTGDLARPAFTAKLYTEDGNWDIVGNNLKVFFIRDAIKFPDFIHSFKPDPVTNRQKLNR